MKLYKQEDKKMQVKEFRLFVESELVESVVITRVPTTGQWAIAVSGSRIPPRVHEWVETAKGEVRNFSDLSTAYGVVRDAGWSQSILLEG